MWRKYLMLLSLITTGAVAASEKPVIMQDEFKITRNGLPGNWEIMKYSPLPVISVKMDNNKCLLIGSGDCMMPITGLLADGGVETVFTVEKYKPKYPYAMRIDFRFDPFTRRGVSVHFIKTPDEDKATMALGTVKDNHFSPIAQAEFALAPGELAKENTFSVFFTGEEVVAKLNNHEVKLAGAPLGKGRVAIGRYQFPDIVTLKSATIYGNEEKVASGEKNFRVRLAQKSIFIEPIYCEVKLQDFGSFYQADLEVSGGSTFTKPGQGNYHGRPAEILEDPYLKIVSSESEDQFQLHRGNWYLGVRELIPDYFYDILNELPEWPMKRSIRFAKPQGEFQLIFGAKKFYYTLYQELAESPSETTFTADGEVLESVFPYSTGKVKVELKSSPDKEIIARIPKSDPRYEQAVNFAKKNHFFLENEPLKFDFEISGAELPGQVEITLENAFMEKIRPVEAKATELPAIDFGVKKLAARKYSLELEQLPVGVYHLRLKATDPTLPAEKFFAFEVMPRDVDAPPAPIKSGMPFLHCMRTETRGNQCDSFDPYLDATVNTPHYVSLANFLPWFARDMKLIPTIHAYGRKYFAWLGSRCLDKWHIADNLDLLKESDIAHIGVEMEAGTLFGYYQGYKFEDFIAFAETTRDPFFDIKEMKTLCSEGKRCPMKYYNHAIKNYLVEWLEFGNRRTASRIKNQLAILRKENPKLKVGWYGPAPIYNSRYIGPESWKSMSTYYLTKDEVGYFIYEDYPEASDYQPPRGSFFMGSIMMCQPDFPLTPEIYTDSGGNPDGALIFAHPPFGKSTNCWPIRAKNRVYDYVYGSAFWGKEGFGFWNRFGFQARVDIAGEQIQNLIRAWGKTQSHLPVAPLKSSAYLFSWDSWNTNAKNAKIIEPQEKIGEGTKIATIITAGESIPYAAETAAAYNVLNGFQLLEENLATLPAEKVDILFLPPLRGMKKETLDHIRKLHDAGVSLVAFERVDGLEDIFGVKDSGEFRHIEQISGTDDFLAGQKEFINEERFGGSYIADGAGVLLAGDTRPVLTAKRNGKAVALFFNAPPTAAIPDMLHEHEGGINRENMSRIVAKAINEIHKRFGDADASATFGRLLGAETRDGVVLSLFNRTQEEQTSIVTYRKKDPAQKLVSCDVLHEVLVDDGEKLVVRLKLAPYESPFLVIK